MSRLLDLINSILGRKKGEALVLAVLADFDRAVQKLEAGLGHIDDTIQEKEQTIAQERDAITALKQVSARAAQAKANLVALTGGSH